MNAAEPFVLFEAGDDSEDGGGTIRDQLVHTSHQFSASSQRPYGSITIPLDNGLDKGVEAKLYGKSKDAAAPWHLLETVSINAGAQDVITLTDWWFDLKLTVQALLEDPTSGDFLAEALAVNHT